MEPSDDATRLADLVAYDLPLEREVFGTSQPSAIQSAVDASCRRHLGAGIERYEFFSSSIGSVHGVVLSDGRAVVVKDHGPGSALVSQGSRRASGRPG